MPDFYEVLKGHFEKVRDAQLALELCSSSLQQTRDTITALMEQCFHAFPDVTEKVAVVPDEEAIPLPPSSLEEDIDESEKPPASFVFAPPHTITYPDGVNNGTVQVNYA